MRSLVTNLKKWTRLYLFVLVSFILSACGGSRDFNEPEPIVDTTPPSVASFFPDETPEDFEIDSFVEITFSELMNIDSLMPPQDGIKLLSGSNELDANSEIIAEERDVHLEFENVLLFTDDVISDRQKLIPSTKAFLTHRSGRFALNTEYSVEVDSPARDLVDDDLTTEDDERNFMIKPIRIEFSTEQGEWKNSQSVPNLITVDKNSSNPSIEDQDKNQFSPRLISNANGDTFLIWRQELYTGINQLWATRYNPNESPINRWSLLNSSNSFCKLNSCENAELISEITTTSVIDFDVAVNDQGHFAIVWSQAPGLNEYISIWSKIFDGKNWSSLEEISDTGIIESGHAESPIIGLDGKGNAISVWREHDGQNSRIKANLFKVGQGNSIVSGQWVEAPIYIDLNTSTVNKNPKLSINNDGLGIAVWEQENEGLYEIYSNHIRLNQSDNWVGSERIDLISSDNPEFGIGSSSSPSLAIDENGDAIAIWLKYDGQRNNVWFNRFTGDWQGLAKSLEESRIGDASFPNITIKNSKALAYWIQESNETNQRSLHTSFFTPFTGWQNEEILATNIGIAKPNAKFDYEGNAMVLWQAGLEYGSIKARYYSKLTNLWDTEESLRFGSSPSLSTLFEDGRFLAAWFNETNSRYRIESALFSD